MIKRKSTRYLTVADILAQIEKQCDILEKIHTKTDAAVTKNRDTDEGTITCLKLLARWIVANHVKKGSEENEH